MKKYTKKNYKNLRKSRKSKNPKKSNKSRNSKNPKKCNKSRKSKNPKKSRKIFYLKGGGKKEHVAKLKQEIDVSDAAIVEIIEQLKKYKSTEDENKEVQAKNIERLEGQLKYYTGLLEEKRYVYNVLKRELEEEEKAKEERRMQIAAAVAKAKEERDRLDEISANAKVIQGSRMDAARAKIESPQAAQIQQERLEKVATVDEITELEEDIRKSEENIEEGEKQLEEIKKKISHVTTPPNELEDFRNLYNTLEKHIIGMKLNHSNLLVKYNTLKKKKAETDKKLQKRKAQQESSKAISNPDDEAVALAEKNKAEFLALLNAEEEAGKAKDDADKAKAAKVKAAKAKADADKAKAKADKFAQEEELRIASAAAKAKAKADKLAQDRQAAADAAEREAAYAAAAAAAAQEEEDIRNALALSLQEVSDNTQLAAQSSSGHLELEENLIARAQEDFQNFLMFQSKRVSQSDKNKEELAKLARQMQIEFDEFIESQYKNLSQYVGRDDLQENIRKMQIEFAEFLQNHIRIDKVLKQSSGIKAQPKKSSLNPNASTFTPTLPFSQIISSTNPWNPSNPNNPYASYFEEIKDISDEELRQRVEESDKERAEILRKNTEEANRLWTKRDGWIVKKDIG